MVQFFGDFTLWSLFFSRRYTPRLLSRCCVLSSLLLQTDPCSLPHRLFDFFFPQPCPWSPFCLFCLYKTILTLLRGGPFPSSAMHAPGAFFFCSSVFSARTNS
ncbi:hypothetical protein BRADI_2g17715v3 [Brachypodium distachyon]|uniref:Uncharacterized protein n=1 Tax=Brachypodium distachyon TaxID=15368 RepID=A0A0Q3MLA6_BRADI|nr:hypothetical protein BRADI_2g17715v3 [Brachypodium distachyon]